MLFWGHTGSETFEDWQRCVILSCAHTGPLEPHAAQALAVGNSIHDTKEKAFQASPGHTPVMEPPGEPESDSESASSFHSMGYVGEQVEIGEHFEVIPPGTQTVASPLVDASEVQKEHASVIPSNTRARAREVWKEWADSVGNEIV